MKTLLLTGASGFIGKHLFNILKDDGYHVVGISSKPTNYDLIACDLIDKAAVFELVKKTKPEFMVHTAALSSVTSGTTIEYYQKNVVATENLITSIDTLVPKCRMLFLSTAAVYGIQKTDCLSEDLCPNPVSHYGYSKYICEKMFLNYKDKHDVTIVRPFNIIGHGQSSGFIVPKLVSHFAERAPEIMLGNILPERDYLSVNECCELISQLITNEKSYGEILNICSDRPLSVAKLIEQLVEITNYRPAILSSPKFIRNNEIMKLTGSVKKINSLLPDRTAAVPIKVILEEMLMKYTSYINENPAGSV